MDLDTAEQYAEFESRFMNREISEDEFKDLLCSIPGYPKEFYGMRIPPGADLHIIVKRKRPMVSVPR